MSIREELEAKGYKAYEGEEICVFWNPEFCQHARECVTGNKDVFDVNRRPWIDPNAASGEEIASIIKRCPSNALLFERRGTENEG